MAPSRPPRTMKASLDVAVSVYDSTSLEVSWTAPPHTGGEQISRSCRDQDESFDDSTGTAIKEAVAGQTVYTYLITGLTADTDNVVRVMAYNNQGYGEPTLAVPVGAFEEIQQITVQNSNSTLLLTDRKITYELNVTAGGRSEQTVAIQIGASAWSLQDALQDLDNVGAVVVTRHDHSSLTKELDAEGKAFDSSVSLQNPPSSSIELRLFRLSMKEICTV